MNSNEKQQTNSELILKTEEYDTSDGGQQLSPYQTASPPPPLPPPPPHSSLSSFNSVQSQSLASVNRLVNFNNNLTVNCQLKEDNSNLASPKLEPSSSSSSYNCQSLLSSSSPPLDSRMPIAAPVEMQSSAAGTTPGQHSMSPSLPPQSTNGHHNSSDQLLNNTRRMTSILGGYGLVPPGILGPLDHYRLQLYSYAMNVERLRAGPQQQYPGPLYASGYPGSPGGPVGNGPYAPTRFALSMGLFPNRMFQPEEPKPQHSYIGLIAMAILSSPESKLVLSDIYQYILDNYPYFRSRGPGWRNSIRHNLSLNDCFIKAGRSANGKGHYWAVHPANLDDFRKGDFRRRKAQRKVRKHMGLAVDDEGTDSPSPPPLAITPPPMAPPPHAGTSQTTTAAGVIANLYSQTRKRQFDVASLLAPDDTTPDHHEHHHHHHHHHPQSPYKGHHLPLMMSKQRIPLTEDEDIDVVASDVDDEQEHILRVDEDHPYSNHRSPNNHHHHQYQRINIHQGKEAANNSSSSFSPPLDFNNRPVYHQNSSSPHSQPSSDLTAADIQSNNNNNNNNNQNSTAANWQGLMQHWPNEFGSAAAAAAAAATMDPRIFGRYYSQYMAAAAARRVAGVFPAAAAAAAAAAVIGHQHQNSAANKQQSNAAVSTSLQKQQQQHKQQSYEC
ncbi:fork head domain-containing protein crocodile [Episyrphus balteatus]|uniref:fork head domain-containing protein crocodile n=1 Tax=Episyrphus balteatus TaxID=286459 RepID=UPI00248585BE|nr:fork head domain-containing protein crocodile [Episyrphus balteatus]